MPSQKKQIKGKTLLIRYDLVGDKRYLKTITVDGKIIDVPGNLQVIKVRKKSDLNKDFNQTVKRLKGN